MLRVKRILQVLIYLSALVSCLPVLAFLPWWVRLGLLLAILLGIAGDIQGKYLLQSFPATILSFGVFALFLVQVSLSNLVEPLIQMLCMLLAVRLATEKSPRNMLQLFLLATIVLAASTLLTLEMAYLFYLVLIVLLVTGGLVLLSFYTTDPWISFNRREWTLLLKTMALLPVGSLLLMLVLFVVLPRTHTPLWDFLNPKPAATAGMTDQVRPGSVAELAQSTQTAFRAETRRLPDDALYWRGIVFNLLDGQIWKRSATLAAEQPLNGKGTEVLLQFYSEPKVDSYLVTLDLPQTVGQIRHRLTADGVVIGRRSAGRKINYQVRAQLGAHSRQTGKVEKYLQLPEHLSPRTLQIGEQLAGTGDFEGRIARLEEFFRAQQLYYSTTELPVTETPIETFLFESKRGYCEYFASSFAVLLRLVGVPSRLVGGYLGGEYNELGGYYLVGEDLAHVWVEALDDQGVWQRQDPSRLAVNAAQLLGQSRRQELPAWQAWSDAAMHAWSRLVLNYDLEEQFNLLRQVVTQARDLRSLDWSSLQKLFWVPLLPILGLPFIWRRRQNNRGKRLLRAFRQLLMRSAGVPALPETLGLFELAEATGEPLCREFATIYGRSYYTDKNLSEGDYQRLRQIVRTLTNCNPPIEVAIPDGVGDNESVNR